MKNSVLSVISVLAFAGAASAATVNVLPGDPTWFSFGSAGGGSSGITAYTTIDGDGAVRIAGDRTRWGFGNPFPSANSPNPNLGLLASVSAFSYNWTVTQQGVGVVTAQAPSLRLIVRDPVFNRRVELVWEDGEQALSAQQFVSGAGTLDTLYSGNFFSAGAGRVYAFTGGLGRGLYNGGGVLIPGSDSAQAVGTLAQIIGTPAYVTGIVTGVGSSVGDFIGYSDTIRLAFNGGTDDTYNFLVPSPTAAALLGLGGLAAARRRRA